MKRKRRYNLITFEKDTQERSKYKDPTLKIDSTNICYKWYIFHIKGFDIYAVDAEWVRNNLSAWFGIGGHGRVHAFIPNNEIWIAENHGTLRYMAKTIIHEIYEYKRMYKMSFLQAHKLALKEELKHPKLLSILIDNLQGDSE